jgi:hypothetical protein
LTHLSERLYQNFDTKDDERAATQFLSDGPNPSVAAMNSNSTFTPLNPVAQDLPLASMNTGQIYQHEVDGEESSELSEPEESEGEKVVAKKRIAKGKGGRPPKKAKVVDGSQSTQVISNVTLTDEEEEEEEEVSVKAKSKSEATRPDLDSLTRFDLIKKVRDLEDVLIERRSAITSATTDTVDDVVEGMSSAEEDSATEPTRLPDLANLPNLPTDEHVSFHSRPRQAHPSLTVEIRPAPSATSQPRTSVSVSTPYSGGGAGEPSSISDDQGILAIEAAHYRQELEEVRAKEATELGRQKAIEAELDLMTR